MIYAASLGSAVKKSQKEKAFITQIGRIEQQMPLEPEVSNMDAAILGPKDAITRGAKLQSAINRRHPSVCVIYIYQKDEEKDLIDCEYKRLVKKVDNEAISTIVSEVLGSHLIKVGKFNYDTKDFRIQGDMTPITQRVKAKEEDIEEPEETPVVEEVPIDLNLPSEEEEETPPAAEEAPQKEELVLPETKVATFQPPDPPVPSTPESVDMLAKIREFRDFDLLKKALERDRIISKVLDENASYAQITDMLDILDHNLQIVFSDPFMSPTEKYEKIRTIGLQRSNFKAQANLIIIEKTQGIFDKITTLTEEFVNDRANTIERSLKQVTLDKSQIAQGEIDLDHLLEERTKMQLELMETLRNIIDLYKSMNDLTAEELAELDTQLPSTNGFINDMVSPDRALFTPANTSFLANALMKSLQDQRMKMSVLESRIKTVIEIIFQICNQSDEIIRYQANLINLLRVNRVEDIVVVDTMIKGALRLYVGAPDTGSTATIATHSGILSRTANTLVVDMSGTGRWADYGLSPYNWDQFVANRPEEALCVVTAKCGDPEEIHEVVQELKKALSYYRFINIKLDPSQKEAIGQLSNDAIITHFITDCRASNIEKMAAAVSAVETSNMARKAILIDPPTNDILTIIKKLNLDITTTKVIPVPHLTDMKSCSITRKQPWMNKDIVSVFEGAFK